MSSLQSDINQKNLLILNVKINIQFILKTENNSLLKMLKYGGKGFFSDSPLFSRRSDSPQESKAVTYPARWTR